MTTTLVSVLLRSNLEWMSILRLMLQTPIADHHNSRDKEIDREHGYQLLAVQESAASVLPMTTTLVSVLLHSNLEWMSILRLMLQIPIADHHSSRDKALDREDGSYVLALEGKLDALVNLVTELAANQKPASIARTTTAAETRHLIEKMAPNSKQFSARNDVIVIRGVHDVATDTSTEARKLEGKLDALVNSVTHLAANQKPVSVAIVCGICSSNDHHTIACPSSQ
ncbi:hypothetical protein Fmac_015256 [Flemingia macrophylla]|uniref:Uncharacterized protein n=1 Tax=Flemingia macrophylla TaxID=520843 RepID=A0ABD1ME24_9FABA